MCAEAAFTDTWQPLDSLAHLHVSQRIAKLQPRSSRVLWMQSNPRRKQWKAFWPANHATGRVHFFVSLKHGFAQSWRLDSQNFMGRLTGIEA